MEIIRQKHPEVKNLRDCTFQLLDLIQDPIIYQRCRYVLEENLRVIQGSVNLEAGDLEAFGNKMYLSHQGLSQQYEVSCPELDLLVSYTQGKDAVLGSRMMGGGFGGCTINIIQKENKEEVCQRILQAYQDQTGIEGEAYFVQPKNGVELLEK